MARGQALEIAVASAFHGKEVTRDARWLHRLGFQVGDRVVARALGGQGLAHDVSLEVDGRRCVCRLSVKQTDAEYFANWYSLERAETAFGAEGVASICQAFALRANSPGAFGFRNGASLIGLAAMIGIRPTERYDFISLNECLPMWFGDDVLTRLLENVDALVVTDEDSLQNRDPFLMPMDVESIAIPDILRAFGKSRREGFGFVLRPIVASTGGDKSKQVYCMPKFLRAFPETKFLPRLDELRRHAYYVPVDPKVVASTMRQPEGAPMTGRLIEKYLKTAYNVKLSDR